MQMLVWWLCMMTAWVLVFMFGSLGVFVLFLVVCLLWVLVAPAYNRYKAHGHNAFLVYPEGDWSAGRLYKGPVATFLAVNWYGLLEWGRVYHRKMPRRMCTFSARFNEPISLSLAQALAKHFDAEWDLAKNAAV